MTLTVSLSEWLNPKSGPDAASVLVDLSLSPLMSELRPVTAPLCQRVDKTVNGRTCKVL